MMEEVQPFWLRKAETSWKPMGGNRDA